MTEQPSTKHCWRIQDPILPTITDLPPAARDFVALWVFAVQQAGRHWYGFVGERELMRRFVEDVRGLVGAGNEVATAESPDGVAAGEKVAGEYEPGSGV